MGYMGRRWCGRESEMTGTLTPSTAFVFSGRSFSGRTNYGEAPSSPQNSTFALFQSPLIFLHHPTIN
ncbi:uncharacterized protein G2W53_003697 [Senna tora]|uniref:Uncharacterized protein n=1 Tax=Senna tora TaxID=362788 RepID=A0A834XBY9_9FABA|nr:uncharacterized protein G2W53_003697 [Senna tora]